MTPRTSVRAAAREIYAELTQKEARASARTSAEETPGPSPQAGGEDLMAQVRALYEDSAVPVREIAAHAGVTERTIYKYACKGQWRPRYLWSDASACMLERGWRAAHGFAPVTGAGGRFIRREDAGKPFAKGLKALDADARATMEAECAQVARRAHEAEQKAELERLRREPWRALRLTNRCMDDILRFWKKYPPGRRDPETERAFILAWQHSVKAIGSARLACDQFESRMNVASPAQNAPPHRE